MSRPNRGWHVWLDRRTGMYQARLFQNGKYIVRSLRTRDQATAEERLKGVQHHAKNLATDLERSADTKFFRRMLIRTRITAKSRNLDNDLTLSDVLAMWEASGGYCLVTGVQLVLTQRCGPWLPTIDRIDSSLGYHVNNCRIVCFAANMAMRNWGDWVLRVIAESMAKDAGIPVDNRRSDVKPYVEAA